MNNFEWPIGLKWLYDDSLSGWSLFTSAVSDALIFGTIFWVLATLWFRYQLQRLSEEEKCFDHISISTDPLKDDKRSSETLAPLSSGPSAYLVVGSVVLSHDAFRSISIVFRRLIGGEVSHYNRLVDQGRREAILRMKRDADDKGFNKIINVRVTTSTIAKSKVELLAFGTGIID